jgi:ribosomal protein S18 acetylase RimI-like enzyme
MRFKYSDFDSKCFDRKIATAVVPELNHALVDELREELRALGCELGFLKTETFPRALIAQGLANQGLEIADIKLWFTMKLGGTSSPEPRTLAAEFRTESALGSIEEARKPLYGIADRSRFGFYFGSEKARKLYDSWLDNLRKDQIGVRWSVVTHLPTHSCAGIMAARVFDGEGGRGAEWDLVGVSEGFQGQGIGKAMAGRLIRDLANEGVSKISVGTLIDNRDAANFYQTLGFRLEKIYYQFHLHASDEGSALGISR